MRTDTVLLPRVIATAAHPLTLTARPRRWLALLLVTLAIGGVLGAAVAGRALAWQQGRPAGEATRLELELPCCTGTDAGLVATPAGTR